MSIPLVADVTATYPEHPDDIAARNELIVKFIAIRQRQQLTCYDVSRLAGMHTGWCGHGERSGDLLPLSRLFQWSTALKSECVIEHGLGQIEPQLDPWGQITRWVARGKRDPFWRSAWEICKAVGVRKTLGLSRKQVAGVLDIDLNTIGDWELGRKPTSLSGLQRYIRALGGQVTVEVVERS